MMMISSKIKEQIVVGSFDVVRTGRLEIVPSGKGDARAVLDVIDNEAVFCLTNESGLRAVQIRAGRECGAEISLIRDGHISRFVLALTKTDRVILSLLNQDGEQVYTVECDQIGRVSKP